MFIPEEKISEILNASDIIEVISDSVTLKKTGSNYVGLCPFHSEKTPSFSVSPQKQIFHCFGCSSGGNVISFLMKHRSISFPEAANILAKRYGIVLETRDISTQDRQRLEFKEGLFRVNNRVREYYTEQLKKSQSAALARDYLKRRSISPEIIDEFGIGYAPDRWDSVVSLLRRMKLSKRMAEQSGLVLKQKTGNGYYDRFRNRIIFPIFDVNMQVAGFGGRVMDDSMPKYLNSPETLIYSKGRILYGFHAAKRHCRQSSSVYIVEGYFDFISLYQSGIKNCVATLGTALTEEHVRLLKGCASRIFIVFDSDEAGVKAARRSVDLFIREGVELRIILLPKGHDPDSFVTEYGSEAFESVAMKSVSAIEFLTEMALKKHGLSIEGKVAILEEMKGHLAAIQDSTARSLYIRDISQRLGIDECAVLEKVRQTFTSSNAVVRTLDNRYVPDNRRHLDNNYVLDNRYLTDEIALSTISTTETFIPREQQIISMMLQFPEIIDEVRKEGVLDCFYSYKLRDIGMSIINVSASFFDHAYMRNTGSYGNETGNYFGDKDTIGFAGDVMASAKSEADRELIASLAMIEIVDSDNIMAKFSSLIKRIIHVKKRNDSTLTHEIRRIEQMNKRTQTIQTLQSTQAGQDVTAEQDSNIDPTLELLRQHQSEIRKLRGYE
ncbi:MAG: DNA primase [Desulfamplus sp.]|nr:DNA primase [Desulfamplus sp.]